MKTYYSLLSPGPRQSFVRSLAEPVFVLCCVGAFCAILWFTGKPSTTGDRRDVALVQTSTR
ncbi:MAG: hypothetical protein ABUL68_03220 [Pseudomonadota bacterium]